ncbi:MAG: ribosomal protein S18-alanine N-acetyltransferase [Oscillospiraceae bacterium]|jgi:ribosomal-protein-alanine N-acetyltransferase|nr:ribosomal protein S18-alanine N-acetyltransferase [Oscillospiraceae bacterium]
MEIRQSTETDVPQLRLLEERCFADPWSQRSLRDTIREDRCFFLSALENGRICGYLNTTYVLDELNIHRVCVLPEYRRIGVGTAMMTRLMEFCRREGLRQVFLEVRKSNLNAQRLYKRFGFTAVGERANFYQHPTEPGFVMRADPSLMLDLPLMGGVS